MCLCLFFAACNPTPSDETAIPPTQTLFEPTDTPTPLPPTSTATPLPTPTSVLEGFTTTPIPVPQLLPAAVAALIDTVIAELQEKQNVSADEIRLIGLKTVRWNPFDCTQKPPLLLGSEIGLSGYRMVLQVETDAFVYFTAGDFILWCENAPLSHAEGFPLPFDPLAEDLVRLAVSDLAGRLDVPEYTIRPVDVLAITWTDTSFGCPVENGEYAPQMNPGYRIILKRAETFFAYHTDAYGVMFCADEVLPAPFVTPES